MFGVQSSRKTSQRKLLRIRNEKEFGQQIKENEYQIYENVNVKKYTIIRKKNVSTSLLLHLRSFLDENKKKKIKYLKSKVQKGQEVKE